MYPRVNLPDGSYTLVSEGGDEGADGDVHYVTVEQDPSPKGPKANSANEGKPGSLAHVLVKLMQLYLL
jgi:hypothetical protein